MVVVTCMEFLLGVLYSGPAGVEDLKRWASRYCSKTPCPWTEEDLDREVNILVSTGLLVGRNGVLMLERDRLHPVHKRIAETVSREVRP
ncbi:MAG: hypothetical protein GSR86_05025 [Desulfurococcales archaeon]|nr:hypothetical protein [Desulfurococcales archaeon]